MKFISSLSICSSFFLVSCYQVSSFNSINEYIKWTNDQENGFIKEIVSGDKKITVKYLTPEYLSYNEIKNTDKNTKQSLDSLLNFYSHSRTFLLTIGPANEISGADIQMGDVSSNAEYDQRTKTLNFHLNDYIVLKSNNDQYDPVLVNMENLYGLQKYRKFFIVFTQNSRADDLFISPQLDFIFNDEIFQTGIHHFVFDKQEIDKKFNYSFLKI